MINLSLSSLVNVIHALAKQSEGDSKGRPLGQRFKPRVEAEFLDKIQTKVLRVFLLATYSHLYCEISISSNSLNLLQFVQEFSSLLFTVTSTALP
jgi:hypothetical protein